MFFLALQLIKPLQLTCVLAGVVLCRCLSDVVQLVYRGLNDGERIVRNAALFALGQLSEHLQVPTLHCWKVR